MRFSKNYQAVKTNNVAIVLPASLGFAFYINKRFSVLTEFGYRYALTDALDGINKLNTSGKDSYVTASLKLQYTFHPLKKRRAKYVAPPEGYSAPSGGGASKAPKDSTLNAPILPPGEIAPPATPTDSSSAKPGDGSGQITAPPVEEKPKELTDEEKKKIQEEKEQKEWEESAAPKKAQPADKKKKEESSGW